MDVSAAPANIEPLRPSDPTTIGPYRLLGRLGAGGMSEVFLGRDRAGRLAAVKLVHDAFAGDPTFRARFAREVRIARRIRIASTAALIDANPHAPVPWLATEYIDGPALDRLVAAQGPMAEPAAGALAARLAATLAELHGAGVVHRDVKPSNVLIAADGPRLIDFGIASAADATAITRSGTLLGAPEYMSPEQALGTSAGPPADVFSLAAVVVYAVTGHAPFGSAAHPVAMLRRIVDEPPNLQDVPDDLRVLLEPCLAKDPTSRPPAGELADSLRRRYATVDVPVDEHPRTLGRRRLLRAAVLGVAVAGAATAVAAGPQLISLGPRPPRGTTRWAFETPEPYGFAGLSFAAGIVIADGEEFIYGLEPHDGRLRWKIESPGTAYSFRTTTGVRDMVYATDRQGIVALDATTGSLRWEQKGAEVLTAGETVLLGKTAGLRNIDGGELFGIDLDTGETRWRYPIPDSVTQLAVSEGLLHVGFRGALTTFEANSGAIRWAMPWGDYSLGGLSTYGDALISAQWDRLVSLDAATGEVRWTVPFDGSQYAAPATHDGTVFANEGGKASARDAETGQLLWSTAALGDPDKATFTRNPAVLGSSVYLLASSDPEEADSVEICALDIEVGAYQWTIPLNASLTNTPAAPVPTTDTVCVASHRAVLSVGP